jgi:putative endopeptidase
MYNNYKTIPKYSDDFYTAVNYNWLTTTRIPDDEIKYTQFIQTQITTNDKLKQIAESNVYPLFTKLYKSFLNEEYQNSKGIGELKELIQMIDPIQTHDDLITMAVRLLYINVVTIFKISIDVNIFSSNEHILNISQPILGLPDREYYHNSKFSNIRQSYYNMICLINKELYPDLSLDVINQNASTIIDIEAKISIILIKSSERNDKNIYHNINLDDIITKYKKLKFKKIINLFCLFSDIDYDKFKNVIIAHKNNDDENYFLQIEKILDLYTIEQWKEYFKYRIIIKYMNLTNSNMKNYYFEMFNKILLGQNQKKKLWRIALISTANMLTEPVSKLYVDTYINSDIELYVTDMVNNIKKATEYRINKLDWMRIETKQKAILKLNNMKLKISYNKGKIRDYNHIKLTSSPIKNTLIISMDNMNYHMKKLNKKVNKEEWNTPSYIVNAYYNPSRNEIIFPAAILQPPFLDITKSYIYNYANFGSIIAHEIIHGFDNNGSKFDHDGNLNNWWMPDDLNKYNAKVNKIIDIYNKEGIDGKLTAGENIADFASVILPLYGIRYQLNRLLTVDEIKQFYIEYTKHWQYLMREEAAQHALLKDPHSFAYLRTNIPLKNQKLFQKVFEIKEGDKMFITDNHILKIW